jgi:general secretion pathway protein J
MNYRFSGFTLLEMLVVLFIVSLISTLLLEGFTHILQLRSRFLVQLDNSQKGAIQEYWFQSTTAGIVTDYYKGENIFKGNEKEFSGLTLMALDAKPGVPTFFAWQLQYQDGTTKLSYKNRQGESWEVTHWFSEQGRFQYQDEEGEWHDQWPPIFGLQNKQIPRLIVLHGQRRQILFTWIVKLTDYDKSRSDFRLYE